MPENLSKTTTDHETIRRWVEERGGSPAEVASTAREGQTGIIRVDFPGFSGEGKLRRIAWDEWFEKFDASGLAFVYEDETSGGQRSNFNKLVSRETAAARRRGARTSRGGSRGGRTGARAGTSSRAGGRARTAARKTPSRKSSRGGAARTAKRTGARTTRRSTGRRQASRTSAARSAGRTTKRGGAARRSGGSRRKSRSR